MTTSSPPSPAPRISRRSWLAALPLVLLAWALAHALPLVPEVLLAIAQWPQFAEQLGTTMRLDTLSYLPVPDEGWLTAPWLSIVAFGAAHAAGGLGLVTAVLALVLGAALVLLWRAARVGRDPGGVEAAWLVVLLMPMLLPGMLAGGALPLLAAGILLLVLRTGYWWLAPLVLVAWAQVHWTAPVGVLLCTMAAANVLGGPVRTWSPRLRRPAWRPAWLAACLLASMLSAWSPAGWLEYWRALHREAGISGLSTPLTLPLAGTVAVAMLVGIFLVLGWGVARGRLGWQQLLPILVLTVLLPLAGWLLPWIAVAAIPALAQALTPLEAGPPAPADGDEAAEQELERSRLAAIRIPALGAVALVSLMGSVATLPGSDARERLALSELPLPLEPEARAAVAGQRVFSSRDWAAGLAIDTVRAVGIDARPARFGEDQLEAYVAASRGDLEALVPLLPCQRTLEDGRGRLGVGERGGAVIVADAVLVLELATQRPLIELLRSVDGAGPVELEAGIVDRVEVEQVTRIRGGEVFRMTCWQRRDQAQAVPAGEASDGDGDVPREDGS